MKGFTTDKQLGKRDGRRYYQQKGVEGIVSASINQGMSSRVKNDAAYANTRLNNAEFGAAGSTAGAITRSLSQKWRYLLVPFAAGKLAKDVRALMMDDTTNPWGQRSLQGTDWQKILADKVSQYSKNPVSDYTGLEIMSKLNAQSGVSVAVNLEEFHNDILESKGATGVRFVVLSGAINASKYNEDLASYVTASNDFIISAPTDQDFGADGGSTMENPKYKQTVQQSDELLGGIVICLPYKTVNGTKHILQELCSFQMIAAQPANTTNVTGGGSHAPESGNGGGSQTGGSNNDNLDSDPEF